MIYNLEVNNDKLNLISDKQAVTGNVNYYYCGFSFSDDWEGLSKFVTFRIDKTESYIVSLEGGLQGECLIPSEVLRNTGLVYIGCYATNSNETDLKRISTNFIYIKVDEGAFDVGTTPIIPTADIWEAYVLQMQTSETNALESEVNAKISETNTKTSEVNAKASENNAKASEDNVKLSETNAKTSETNAKLSEVNAKASETNALNAVINKVDKVDGKSLVSLGQIEKLAELPTFTEISNTFDGYVLKDGIKVLSDNNYTTAEKTKLTALPTNTVLNTNLGNKVDKIAGKGLSTNDYTTAEKTKLGALPTNATLNTNLGNKADKVTGKSLVADTEITKLTALPTNATLTTNLNNKLNVTDYLDTQTIVDLGSNEVEVVFTPQKNKYVYKASVESYQEWDGVETNTAYIAIVDFNQHLANINFRFEIILEITNLMGNIPSVVMSMETYPYPKATWVVPPVIEYPNTINKFVFETWDSGATWYGNQCYSYEVI